MTTVDNERLSRSSRLDPATLNEKFSDVTTVTTAALDAENVAREGIDLANVTTVSGNGISDIILRSAEQAGLAASGAGQVVINANLVVGSSPTAPTYLNGRVTYGAAGISLVVGDIIRTYWSINATTTFSTITPTTTQELWWVFWLEWDITSNALVNWVKVPGQGNFKDDITGTNPGTQVANLNACSFVAHRVVLLDKGAAGSVQVAWEKQPVCGSWVYRATGSSTLFGLRLVGGGLVYPNYDGVNLNSVRYADGNLINGTQRVTLDEGILSALIMRDD